ncbi:MAG: polysaccharide deacetylase family protein [Acidimicrobiia bacterium]|nr:polysaccharide deacetylase family protein [Acidimicrobiia bacterium]
MSPRALAIGFGLVLVAAGCSGERSSGHDLAVSGGAPQATVATAPTVPRTTSTTTTQPEARPEPASPPAEDPVEVEVPTPATSVEPEPIGWEDLEHLTVEVDGEVVRLEGGRATVSYGGASATSFTLQNRVAQGDLDGDGDEDVVAHIVQRSPGTGVFHLIVPVINDEGAAAAQSPIAVGDRVVVDAITVRDGLIDVSLFDRAQDEPFTIISRHTTLEIDLSSPAPLVRVIDTEPIEDMPMPGPERPEVNIRFEPGAVSATEPGTIDFRERQTYTVYASEGQPFTATLEAPLGVWLDVRLDHLVVTSASQRSQLVEAELPATGPWKVTVISSHAGESGYELTVEALPRPAAAPVPTTTAQAVTVPRPVTPDHEGVVVYLTFDDGPNPDYTPQVLDVLARHDARATFFVVGSLAQAYPDIIQRIAAEGHTIANHSWNHEDLAGLSRAAFDETISRTQAVLGDLAAPCLRPPYGSIDAFTREWAASHGLTLLTWDASPADWLRPPAEEIADYIVKWARPGVVLLMHDGGGDRSRTVQGLDMALERLADRGLRYEPVCR